MLYRSSQLSKGLRTSNGGIRLLAVGAGFASGRSCLRQVLRARFPLEAGLLLSLRRLSGVSKPASAGAAELDLAVKCGTAASVVGQEARYGLWTAFRQRDGKKAACLLALFCTGTSAFSEATEPCDAVRSNINAAVGRVSHGLDV